MDAKELRIGNYCKEITHSKNGVVKVSKQHFEDIEDNQIDLFPIPLTEEWLLRFKEVEKKVFDSEETGYGVEYHIKINENLIINIQDDMSFCLESISDDSKYVYLENDFLDTVHFLQNIYNVLTKGKELTIK